jgi:hypothetical protein
MTIKNGDLPAMPINYNSSMLAALTRAEAMGLTKREMFAMAAMQGLFASNYAATIAQVAADAVSAADALLAELERTK